MLRCISTVGGCLGAMAVLKASGHSISDNVSTRDRLLKSAPIAVARDRAIYDFLAGLDWGRATTALK